MNADGCKYLSDCYKGTLDNLSVCFPKFLRGYSQQQFADFHNKLTALDEKLYGSCAAACWLKRSHACLSKRKAGPVACQKAPYCFWSADEELCIHNTLEFESSYDKQVKRLYVSSCTALSSTSSTAVLL